MSETAGFEPLGPEATKRVAAIDGAGKMTIRDDWKASRYAATADRIARFVVELTTGGHR